MLNYLLLPAEQTEFEQQHLARTLRIALGFFWMNVPLFMLVALFNGTGILTALVLGSLTMIGPTAAYAALSNRRHVSVIMGITAMCMGGLLVHFGQGPMQIEMHFYFFSILAVLSVFGNPMVIIAAAVTVTLHHTVIWYLIPESVFNYEASIFVVAVHAAFVVVESIASVYMARSYFDNVIGLEKKVAERTAQLDVANRSMRLVMQHVNQGLVTIDRTGAMASERSARVAEWLGDSSTDDMVEYLRKVDASAAEWFELGFQDLLDGFMPLEVTIEQLPQTVTKDDRLLKVEYIPIHEPESDTDFDSLLVVLSDITSEVEQAHAERRQRQAVALVQHLLDDPSGVKEFIESGSDLLRSIAADDAQSEVVKRVVHTLKGNALSLDLDHFGEHLHALEDKLVEEQREPTPEEMAEINEEWASLVATVERVAPSGDLALRIQPEALDQIMRSVQAGVSPAELLSSLRALRHGSPAPRLERMGEQAKRLAGRLCKELDVVVDDGGIRVPLDELKPLWASLTHALRNAVDHGIETPEERAAAGKSGAGTLTLAVADTPDGVTVSIADDGRGIDWKTLRERAAEQHIDGDDIDLLFADGVSSREEATQVSGRGVGMSALRQSIEELGGTIHVESELGVGTRILFTVPHSSLQSAAA